MGTSFYYTFTKSTRDTKTKDPYKELVDSMYSISSYSISSKPIIKKVIFNGLATIVIWSDGVKTVVKCEERDTPDPEKGLAMAISKRFFGNKGNYYNNFKKWIPKMKDE